MKNFFHLKKYVLVTPGKLLTFFLGAKQFCKDLLQEAFYSLLESDIYIVSVSYVDNNRPSVLDVKCYGQK